MNLIKNRKFYREGNFRRQSLIKTVEIVCKEKIYLGKAISLSNKAIAERIDETSGDLKQQMKAVSSRLEYFYIFFFK